MTYSPSRRRFLGRLTALSGGAVLGHAPARAAKPRRKPLTALVTPEQMRENYAHADAYQSLIQQPVYRAMLVPHWFADNTRFWYRNDGPEGTKEFMLVDAEKATRGPAFDHARLAASLSHATGTVAQPTRLPFRDIAFTSDDKVVQFYIGSDGWRCDLATYACIPLPPDALPEPSPDPPPVSDPPAPAPGLVSPDGKWTASLQNGNVMVQAGSGPVVALTTDSAGEIGYDGLAWSPDSRTLAGFRVTNPPIKPVYLIESSPPYWSSRGILHQHEYAQPGDPLPTYEAFVFDPAARTAMRAQTDVIDFGDLPEIRWLADGDSFTYEQRDRNHQFFRVIKVAAQTGAGQAVIEDTVNAHCKFINTSNIFLEYPQSSGHDEILYASELDGWRHLSLYDRRQGHLENQVTQGSWVVRAVDRVDPQTRQIWFRASGKNPGEDPYQMHLYRVNFDGTGLTTLTEGNGEHLVQWSPDNAYLIDTYSRPDLPPVHTLRRGTDGTLVCDLEKADVSALAAQGWRAPEVFHAKGRDGMTDIWGLVFRPLHFDPARKYPVIENIYAGPQDSFVRKLFAVYDAMQSLAELGFIVVQCDGMGTRNRSKAFHDVCWHNLADAGLPDRIAWITALAAQEPAADIDRVGIYGTSAGGQNSTGALLWHPKFYKVAVSSCGCHDNRIDKQWWNEQWMGYPPGPWYGEQSNITNAHRLRGKLLLFVGELDTNVPPESTIRLTDALIKAGKDYELVIITGSNHTDGGPYGERRRRDFFVRHLLGAEPPDRNIPVPPPTPIVLKPLSPEDEDQAQGIAGEATTITFTNHAGQPVTLYWLPGDGTHKKYATLAPNQVYVEGTYAGHWWLIVGADGQPRSIFVGSPRPGLAEIK